MSNNLRMVEASASFLGRKNKIVVWDGILTGLIEPPKYIYATGIYRQIVRNSNLMVNMADVTKELNTFQDAGMLAKTTEHDLSPNSQVYVEAESEGWLIVNAAVETFRLWYPELRQNN